MAKYAILKNEIHTWNKRTKSWDIIPVGTKGRIVDYTLTPLSITYRLIFNEGREYSAIEYVNIKDLELV